MPNTAENVFHLSKSCIDPSDVAVGHRNGKYIMHHLSVSVFTADKTYTLDKYIIQNEVSA